MIADLVRRVDRLERRRPVAGHYQIKLFADDQTIAAGDGAFTFAIPFDLNKAQLRYVNAYVSTVSSADPVVVQIQNTGTTASPIALDMLSTPITIDPFENDAETSSSRWFIQGMEQPDPSYAQYGWPYTDNTVFFKQQLRIDVDSPGTGAKGLGLQLGFDA